MLDYTKPLQYTRTGDRVTFIGVRSNGSVVVETMQGNIETCREPEKELKNFDNPTEFWAPLRLAMQPSGHLAIKVDNALTSDPRAIVTYSAAKGWGIGGVK